MTNLIKKSDRDENCPHKEVCEEMHGQNGDFDYIKCPGFENCLEPCNSYYDGLENGLWLSVGF